MSGAEGSYPVEQQEMGDMQIHHDYNYWSLSWGLFIFGQTLRRFRTHLLCIIQNRCDFAGYSEHLSKLLRIEEVINFEYKLSMSPVQLKE